MPATYLCKACNATWSDDGKPTGCPNCGSRNVQSWGQALGSVEDRYNPPESSISAMAPVNSTSFTITYWLGWAGFIVGFALVGAAGDENEPVTLAGGLVILASAACMIAGYIVSFVKIYRAWALIQPLRQIDRGEVDMPTPGAAVGLLFVPFFNLYWNFVALFGLATRANKFMARYKIDARPMNAGLAQTYCILFVCAIIPCVGIVIALANVVIYYLLILDIDRMRDAVQAWQMGGSKAGYIDEFEPL